MKKSIGSESQALAREARKARRASAASGGVPSAVAAMMRFCAGQMMPHTLRSMTTPSAPPMPMESVLLLAQWSRRPVRCESRNQMSATDIAMTSPAVATARILPSLFRFGSRTKLKMAHVAAVMMSQTWAIYNYVLLPNLNKDGKILAAATAGLVIAMSVALIWWLDSQLTGRRDHWASNKTLSIGIGGALGIIMLLNVWGIIWPAQKRIIAATEAGTPPDAALARRAFLASRTNAWLSLPMLFLMGTSHGDWVMFGKNSA